MDTGKGNFAEISNDMFDKLNGLNQELDTEDQIPVFTEGEVVQIKGGKYEVHKIKEDRLILKPKGRSTKHLHQAEQKLKPLKVSHE